MRKMCHELQVMETLRHRMNLSEENEERYQFLKWEDYTKKKFDEQCFLYLDENYPYVNDLWISYDDKEDINVGIEKFILIGHHGYLIHMHNGCFHLNTETGKWQGNPTFISKSNFKSLQKTRNFLQHIYRESMVNVEIDLIYLFLAPQEFKTESILPGKIIKYEDIELWLCDLQKEQNKSLPITQPTTYAMDWARELELYSTEPSLSKMKLDLSEKELLKKGICCDDCHFIDMSEVSVGDENAFLCNHCGAIEPIEIAYARTICEWGTIFNDQDLIPSELEEFFGKDLRKPYLDFVLKRHFTPIDPRTL